MSCSLYRYTEECDGQVCVGDCDLCDHCPDTEENKEWERAVDELYGRIMTGNFVGHCPPPKKEESE